MSTSSVNIEDTPFPLQFAVEQNVDLTTLLQDLDYNLPDQDGDTALHTAAKFGNYEAAAQLISQQHCHINPQNQLEQTPLHLAIQHSQESLSLLLLHNDADVNVQDNNKNTALHLAVTYNSSSGLISAILERKPNLYLHNKDHKFVFELTDNQTIRHLLLQQEVHDTILDDTTVYDLLSNSQSIGTGSFGEVSKVVLKSGYPVAIKKGKLGQPDLVETSNGGMKAEINNTIVKEFQILKSINHPNALKLFAGTFYANNLLIFMEFVNGGNLRSHIKSLKPINIQTITVNLVDCLVYLHGETVRIMHRDIKPENILLSITNEENHIVAKLGDFGLSKVVTHLDTDTHTNAGTSIYKAPELNDSTSTEPGKTRYDFKADIWSLGIVFVEMWTQKPTTKKANNTDEEFAEELINFIMKSTPHSVTDIGIQNIFGILEFASGCLKVEKQDRYDAEQLKTLSYTNNSTTNHYKSKMPTRNPFSTL